MGSSETVFAICPRCKAELDFVPEADGRDYSVRCPGCAHVLTVRMLPPSLPIAIAADFEIPQDPDA